MSYSNGRTNRSSASLLARCIVAGGGAGWYKIATFDWMPYVKALEEL